ncbi:hypothetical protein QQG55_28590 [Brugia pahangi]
MNITVIPETIVLTTKIIESTKPTVKQATTTTTTTNISISKIPQKVKSTKSTTTTTTTITTIYATATTISKILQEKIQPTIFDSRLSIPPISPIREPKLSINPTDTEEPRSTFVLVLLGVSATVMITSLALILLIKFGVIFQQPMRSSLQRGQIDEAL